MNWFNTFILLAVIIAKSSHSSAETQENNETQPGLSIKVVESDKKNLTETSDILKRADNNVINITENATTIGEHKVQKKDSEKDGLGSIKPFLLFPIFPLLFANDKKKIKQNHEDLFSYKRIKKEESEKKPFIFLDLATNMHQTPLKNINGKPLNDSKIIKVQKFVFNKISTGPTKKSTQRKKRSQKKEIPGFFDEFPVFPDLEIESDFFFQDIPFHRKSIKKLSRKKRDKKIGNEMKLFLDPIDEFFRQTKKEFEKTNPLLKLFKEGTIEDDKERKHLDDLDLKWRVVKDVKKPPKIEVKEIQIIDEGESKFKNELKRDTIENNEKIKTLYPEEYIPRPKVVTRTTTEKEDFYIELAPSMMIPGDKEKKDFFSDVTDKDTASTHVESKELKFTPQTNTSVVTVGNNATIEVKNKVIQKEEMVQRNFKFRSKKPLIEDLKSSLTKVLTNFLALVRKVDENKSEGEFDWTEKEALETGILRKKRQEAEYVEDLLELGESKQSADLNYLFMTVTFPTIFVFTLMMLICYFNLRVKGRICTKLFKPRQLLVKDEEPVVRIVSSEKIKYTRSNS